MVQKFPNFIMNKPKKLFSVIILVLVSFVVFLYVNDDIGITSKNIESDIRSSQKISDDWITDGTVSDTLATYISYPQDKSEHTFSVYINRPGFSFGYFFRAGGGLGLIEDYIAEFTSDGVDERAFISMNKQKVCCIEIDDGINVQKIETDSNKPFAVIFPMNAGTVTFYDINGNIVEYFKQSI